MKKVGYRGHPEDPSANKLRENQHTGPYNAQNGSSPTRDSDQLKYRGPVGHPWKGPTPQLPYRGTPGPGEALLFPDANFSWLTKGEVYNLGFQLAEELRIQP